jgi:hypothetical protein
MVKYYFKLAIIFMAISSLSAQETQYEVELVPFEIPQLGGLQSYAFGTYENDWLIIGGRLDGLHRRQPFASFDEAGNNKEIIVANPASQEVWKYPLAALPANLRKQFSSTNIQFYQDEDYLILTGGYAYSPSVGDHITFPYLTILHIPSLIEQVKSGQVDANTILQSEHENFRVAGGSLAKIEDTYYLVGGNKFMGRYNPMGPNHGPGFIQEYTNEVRKFKVDLDNPETVEFFPPIHDERHLHRRDYNLLPFIYQGEYGLMAYSGVFQPTADVPWLYPVYIDDEGITPYESFSQYFNHYHCASLPIYNEASQSMNTIFFGGIAQFYKDNDLLVQDNDVPFVTTIASVSMDKEGNLNEQVLNTEMPDLLGASSEFIFTDDAVIFEDGILDGDELDDAFKHIGYIYGGIKSSLPNIFFINTGTESTATNTIFKVMVKRVETTQTQDLDAEDLSLLIYPNPAQNFVKMSVELEEKQDVEITIFDSLGQQVHSVKYDKQGLSIGMNYLTLDKVNINYGAYLYRIKIGTQIINRRVIWSE